MRKTSMIFNTIAGVLVAIPIIIAKIKLANATDPTVRPVTEAEVESIIAHYNEPETVTEIETVEINLIGSTRFEYDFIPLDRELQEEIITICTEHEIAYDLILAVMKTESEFTWVTGDNGDSIGYMQIQPQWWTHIADFHGLDLYKPLDNVHAGIIILDNMLESNGGALDKALKQYNSGNPDYPGNEYTSKVYANYEWILKQKEG